MQRPLLRVAFGALFSAIAACGGTVQDRTQAGKNAADADAATGGVDASLIPDGGGGNESTGGAGGAAGGTEVSGGASGTAGQMSSDGNTECVSAYGGCFTTEDCCPSKSGEIVCYVPPGSSPPPDGGHPYFPPGRCTEPSVRPDGGSCTPASYECLSNADCCSDICMNDDGTLPVSDARWTSGACQPAGCVPIGSPCAAHSDCCPFAGGFVACNDGVCAYAGIGK